MPAFQFDSSNIEPAYGSGSQLPIGKHPVVIVGTELKPTKDGQGGYLAITLEAIDGPAKGVQAVDRLNLHNKNADTVRIANQQLSAYCHVTGVFRFQATEELHGKPFVVEIGPDTRATTEGRTEVKKLFDMNGNAPGQAGAGAPTGGNAFAGQGQAAAAPPPAAQGGFQPGAGTPATDPNAGQGGGNAWGQGQPNAGQGAAPAGGQPAWSQGGAATGATGGQPGWGQR